MSQRFCQPILHLAGGQVLPDLLHGPGRIFQINDGLLQDLGRQLRVILRRRPACLQEEGQSPQVLLDGIMQFLGDLGSFALLSLIHQPGNPAQLVDLPSGYQEQDCLLPH